MTGQRATALIVDLAAVQHRVVTRRQLIEHGLEEWVIDERLASGLLSRRHRGVYVVGRGAETARTAWLAAVWACRAGTCLSHWDAAALWGLAAARDGDVHVTVPGRGGVKRVKGIKKHQARTLPDDEVNELDGIRVAAVARVFLDIAPGLSTRKLEQTAVDAVDRGLYDGTALRRLAERHAGHPGARRIRDLLDLFARQGGARRTRSVAEVALLAMCDEHGLPTPHTNVTVHGHEVDAHWPEADLVIEVDGWQFHRTRAQREHDGRKRLAIQEAGTPVVVLSYDQVTTGARRTAAALAARLTAAR